MVGNMLVQSIRETIKKDKRFQSVQEARESKTFRTGIDVFDFVNGRSENGMEKLGIDDGKITYIVGRSGSGKTTLAQQAAVNIVKDFDQGTILHCDVENSADRSRIRKLSGWSIEEFNNKYIHINTGMNSETFFSLIRSVADTKIKNRDQYEYDTGMINQLTGKPEMLMQPTVVILDSLSSLVTKDVSEEEELSGSMTASHNAKVNAGIFRRLVDVLSSANITLIVINHITDNIDINPMQRKKAQVNFLAQSESIPGGKVPVFLANTLIKLDPGKKLKETEDYGKEGFLVKLQIIKSRSNSAGRIVDLVFFPKEGFSNVITNFEFLTSNKLISGSGHGYYTANNPDQKFKRKGLEELYNSDPNFAKLFDEFAHEQMRSLLAKTDDIEVDDLPEDFMNELEPVENEENLYLHKSTNKYYEIGEDDQIYEVIIEG